MSCCLKVPSSVESVSSVQQQNLQETNCSFSIWFPKQSFSKMPKMSMFMIITDGKHIVWNEDMQRIKTLHISSRPLFEKCRKLVSNWRSWEQMKWWEMTSTAKEEYENHAPLSLSCIITLTLVCKLWWCMDHGPGIFVNKTPLLNARLNAWWFPGFIVDFATLSYPMDKRLKKVKMCSLYAICSPLPCSIVNWARQLTLTLS